MKSNFKKLDENKIKATVELDRQDLQEYIDQAVDILGEGIEVKGFRKGKIPKKLIRKHLDQDQIKAAALEIAVEQSLSKVIKDGSLDVLDTAQLSVEKNDKNQLIYSAIFELFPKVQLVNLSGIKIKRQEINIEEKEIDDTLEAIRNSRATFIDKDENQAIEIGDRVEIDFEASKDGRIIDEGVSKNHPLIIGGRNFIPGFEEQLIGMKKGEEKTFPLTAPENYFHKSIAGRKLEFKVKINDVKKAVKLEINDDFARTLGRFLSLSELKRNIREGLVREKKIKESQKSRLEVLDRIIQLSVIDMPKSMLNKQLDLMISDFDNSLHEKGLELGLYLARIGKTREELRKDWVKNAERQLKISLILRKLSKDLKIEASEEEVEEMIGQTVQAAMVRGETERAEVDLKKIKEEAVARIVNEKTLDYIEKYCVI